MKGRAGGRGWLLGWERLGLWLVRSGQTCPGRWSIIM